MMRLFLPSIIALKENVNAPANDIIDLRVFEAMPGIFALIKTDTPNYTIASVTEDFVRLTGKLKKEIIGQGYFTLDTLHSNSPSAISSDLLASFDAVLKNKQWNQLELIPGVNADIENLQKQQWLVANKPVFDDEGEVRYIIHSLTKNETLINANDQSKEIEKVNHLFMQAPVAICIVGGPDYVVDLVNERMLQFLGRTSSIVGNPIAETLTEAKIQGLISILDQVQKTGQPYYISTFPAVILIEGVRELRYFDLVFKPYYTNTANEKPDRIFCVAHNVTEQMLVRQKLEEEKDRTSLALSVGELGIIEIDWETNKTKADKRCNDIFRFEESKRWEDYITLMDPKDQLLRTKAVEAGIKTGVFEYEARLIFKDGSFKWIRCKGVIYKNAEEKPVKSFGIIQDITEHKNFLDALQEKVEERTYELAEANENLVRVNMELARSNANLEEFAYAASHDLKEPVRKINFFSDNLKRELGPTLTEHQHRLFERVEQATKRMGALIDDLLLYSQINNGASLEEMVDLNRKLNLVLEDLELEIEEKNAVVTSDNLPTLRGHRRQLQQLFQNLIGNALKYSKPGQAPQIHISCKVLASTDLPNFAGKEQDKRYYLIEVKDNGIGFDPDDASRIFNMFTRLHGTNEYRGTGVGLSIVRKVVENHKGHVWAEGKSGEGACFKAVLPME